MTQDTSSQNEHKRAVLYARVSTDEQAESGYSIDGQIRECNGYSTVHKLPVVFDPIKDEGISGAMDILNRPGGKKLNELFTSGKANTLIVYRVDRLSRDNADLLMTIRQWLRLGIEIHFCDIGQIKDYNDITLTIHGWKGTTEHKDIFLRTSKGRFDKAAMNKVVGNGGRTPYGYKFTYEYVGDPPKPKTVGLEPDEKEKAVVTWIFEWYLVGNGDNKGPMSGEAIAVRLSKMGIPTPGEARGLPRKHAPCVWDPTVIYDILDNEVYAGTWRYGKTTGRGKKRVVHAIKDTKAVTVPAIIAPATWTAARARREYNKQMSPRNVKHEYLLRGRVKCGCGLAMVGWTKAGKTYGYYRCKARDLFLHGVEERKCFERPIRIDLLDKVVWDDFVMDILTDPEKFKQGLLDTQAEMEKSVEPKREQLETIEAMIAETEAEANQLAKALSSVKGIVGKRLEEQIDRVNDRYDEQCVKRDKIRKELEEQAPLSDQDIADALVTRVRIVKGLENPTFEMKRQMLEWLGVQVVIKNHKAKVTSPFKIERTFDLATFLCTPTNEYRIVTLMRTFDLDEVSREFFAKVGASVEP